MLPLPAASKICQCSLSLQTLILTNLQQSSQRSCWGGSRSYLVYSSPYTWLMRKPSLSSLFLCLISKCLSEVYYTKIWHPTWISPEIIPIWTSSSRHPFDSLIPWETLPTVAADVRLVHSTIVWTDVIAHAVLPLEPLLADRTLIGLLIWVGQLMPIEVIDVPEGFPAHLACVVLPDTFAWGCRGHQPCSWPCRVPRPLSRGRCCWGCPTDGRHTKQAEGNHSGHLHGRRSSTGSFGPRVNSFMASQVVAIFELFSTQGADVGAFALRLLLSFTWLRCGRSCLGGWGLGGLSGWCYLAPTTFRGWRLLLFQGSCVYCGGSRCRGCCSGNYRCSCSCFLGSSQNRQEVHLEGLSRGGWLLGRGCGGGSLNRKKRRLYNWVRQWWTSNPELLQCMH